MFYEVYLSGPWSRWRWRRPALTTLLLLLLVDSDVAEEAGRPALLITQKKVWQKRSKTKYPS
jgi:hypothetical protein